MYKKEIRVAVYIRTALENNEEVKRQEDSLLEIYTEEPYVIYDIYIDNGYSAVDRNRPAFQRMLNDIRENKIDVIATYSIDRLLRRVGDFIDLFDVLDKYNCQAEFLKEYFSTNSMSGHWVKLYLSVIGYCEKRLIGNE